MLFALPTEAMVENWVGDWLDRTLETGFACIDAGDPSDAAALAEELEEDQCAAIKRHGKLIEAVEATFAAYLLLGKADRTRVVKAMADQNDMPKLFEGLLDGTTRKELPQGIRDPLKELSKRAFEALTTLGIRAASYAVHFTDDRGRLCSFCGYERIDGPLVSNADWDHYLARSLYPFASWKVRNLTPMGTNCNRTYKRDADILRSAPAVRALCFDPYVAPATPTVIHLRETIAFKANERPEWRIKIEGEKEQIENWDRVFAVRNRWMDHLDSAYRACLNRLARNFRRNAVVDFVAIRERLSIEAEPVNPNAPGEDILQNAIFDMLNHNAEIGTPMADRLLSQISSAASNVGRRA